MVLIKEKECINVLVEIFISLLVAGGFAPNRVRTFTAFASKYAYYVQYFSFFKLL